LPTFFLDTYKLLFSRHTTYLASLCLSLEFGKAFGGTFFELSELFLGRSLQFGIVFRRFCHQVGDTLLAGSCFGKRVCHYRNDGGLQ